MGDLQIVKKVVKLHKAVTNDGDHQGKCVSLMNKEKFVYCNLWLLNTTTYHELFCLFVLYVFLIFLCILKLIQI